MLRPLMLCTSLLLPLSVLAVDKQDFEEMMGHLRDGKSEPVQAFLDHNRDAMAKDPDYYVLLLNHAVTTGRSELISLQQGAPEGDGKALVLTDPDSGEVAGHMAPVVSWDREKITAAIEATSAALPAFTDRLDIHFGMISIAGSAGLLEVAGERLVAMLRVSREIDNKWIWGPVGQWDAENPEEFMIQNCLSHGARLFRSESKQGDKAFEAVARALMKYYPKRIYGYANMGVMHLTRDELDEAEKYLNQALKIDPADEVVRGNLDLLKKMRAAQAGS